MTEACWYAVRTKANQEAQAAAILAQRGVEVYLPLLKKKPRAGRRDEEPLFPCYLFGRLAIPSDAWLQARSAPFVAYFVGDNGVPSAIPDAFVSALKSRVGAANGQPEPSPFVAGERVVIADGPFADLEAVFDRRLSASGRAQVLLRVLEGVIRVQLPDQFLRKAI